MERPLDWRGEGPLISVLSWKACMSDGNAAWLCKQLAYVATYGATYAPIQTRFFFWEILVYFSKTMIMISHILHLFQQDDFIVEESRCWMASLQTRPFADWKYFEYLQTRNMTKAKMPKCNNEHQMVSKLWESIGIFNWYLLSFTPKMEHKSEWTERWIVC